VHYVIDAHFEMTPQAAPSDNEGKFCDIMRRRLEKGQCYVISPASAAGSFRHIFKNGKAARS
jgi:hypothetical protein